MNVATDFYWQGAWVTEADVSAGLERLPELTAAALATPLDPAVVIDACERLVRNLATPQSGPVREIVRFMRRDALELKVRRELGSVRPARLTRPDPRETVFEAWAPVGLLTHITPGNSETVATLGAVEGLLAGNLNVVKTSSSGGLLAHELLSALAAHDPTDAIAERLIVLRFPAGRRDWLRSMCQASDAVAVWGGEDAVSSISELVPAGCRLVEWGHKISFGYLTPDRWADPAALEALAHDVCALDQQACSSPQLVYLDTGAFEDVTAFVSRFAPVLDQVAAKYPPPDPGMAEQAEITTVELVARLEERLDLTQVVAAPAGGWRLLADTRPALTASPLYRTLWVKPLPRTRLIETLHPMRRYLQTAGIAAGRRDLAVLSRLALAAGVLRVTPLGSMTDGYEGEPHDGVYALQRYSRRVGVRADDRFAYDACLDDLVSVTMTAPPENSPVIGKDEAQRLNAELAPEYADLYVRSGGTTGEPALSLFTYDDYDVQMSAAAEGLLAAGLDPRTDRAVNLFHAGYLYGGFLSFFSILERLRVVQFPMAHIPEYDLVARTIVTHQANTLLGMPSFIWRLFTAQEPVLRSYGGIKKVLYGGEHFSASQRIHLHRVFGVELIRSAAYGSNDLGPLGYQCLNATGAEHHLLTQLHTLEILSETDDIPVPYGEPGRLVFTSLARRGQRDRRYAIGDIGRWVPGDCPCDRRAPRFELLGRTGDVIRVGGSPFNYRSFTQVAEEHLGYAGDLQLVLNREPDGVESLTVLIDAAQDLPLETVRKTLLEHVPDLRTATDGHFLHLTITPIAATSFTHNPQSGKLHPILDHRPESHH